MRGAALAALVLFASVPPALGYGLAPALGLGHGLVPSTARDMAPAVPAAGGIVLRSASLARTGAVWTLDARADIELPPPIRAGLDSGVPLEFVVALELRERRAFRPDPRVLDVERRYRLDYYELTRHYRVLSLDGGRGRNYRSLGAALEALGTLRDVPFADPDDGSGADAGARAAAPPAAPLYARLELRLDEHALPLPLQSLIGSIWRLASEPRTWTLSPREAGVPRGAEEGRERGTRPKEPLS